MIWLLSFPPVAIFLPVSTYILQTKGSKLFGSAQLLSLVRLLVTPWTAALQASLSIIKSRSLLELMFIESVMPFNHLILYQPLLLPSSILPSITVFSKESFLCIRWPNYWSFSFSISLPMNIQDSFPLGLTGLISLQCKGFSSVFSNNTVQKHQFFSAQLYLRSNSHIHTRLLECLASTSSFD